MLQYILWLTLIKGIGPVTVKRLLGHFSDPREVYDAGYEDLLEVKGIGHFAATSLATARSLQEAELILERCNKSNIKILTCQEPDYPQFLDHIPHAPALIYYRGLAPRDGGVALVGSRKCSAYGKEVVCEAADYLARRNVPVLSGLAAGIDGYAHTACLKAGGYTIAFLGGGIDTFYPSEHRELQDNIAAAGTLLSLFPPGTPAHLSRFPRRNYFMAAWAETVLVVEAGKKSGALLTADYAMQLGKRVMSVPGSIYSSQSAGTNALLNRGAAVYGHPEQLTGNSAGPAGIKKAGFSAVNRGAKAQNLPRQPAKAPGHRKADFLPEAKRELSSIEKEILKVLQDSAMNMDRLAHHFKVDRSSFFEALIMLELDGLLERQPGGIISLLK